MDTQIGIMEVRSPKHEIVECLWKEFVNCETINKKGQTIRGIECNDCDWRYLEFTKEAIEKRISKEKREIRWMYITAKKRKEKEMNDRAVGVFMMCDILEKRFGIENKMKKEIGELIK